MSSRRQSRPGWWPGRRLGDPDSAGGLLVEDLDGAVVHRIPPDVAESVRYLVSRTELDDIAGLPARLALTSSVAGEGVTYISRSLASVVAHDLARQVCLVDLDWWSASRHAPVDGEEPRPGIAEVAGGEATLDEVLVETTEPGLALVPAGSVRADRRASLVRSVGLDLALDELASRYDHLVIELPPVLVTADAITLMRVCERFVFVVRHGVTSERTARDALERLSGASCLGVVLNRASTRVPRVVRRAVNG